jgi:enoyl-CoA hydratase/carnithine racemase
MEIDYRKYEALTVEREDRLLTITLNRPERLNAVTGEMHQELEYIWHDIAGDNSIWAVIITGAGNRAFCAGADMKNMSGRIGDESTSGRQPAPRSFVGAKRIIANMLEVEQPIIGAINGDAVGLGASIALSTDIVIASDRARFADTHTKNLGVVAGDGGTVAWPMMMGIHKAKEYLLTGDFLPAAEAARMGWINYAVPFEEVMPKAREFAMRFAYGPTWAHRWTKTSINKILRERLNLTMDTALASEFLCMAGEDHREAVASFMEKRQPHYVGR